MARIIELVIKKRKITLFAIILALVFGSYSYYIIPKQESPDISVTVALITTVYPGASSEDVERLVTRKIEDKVMEVTGFKTVNSTSQNNLSVVILELEAGTDTDKAWNQLRQKMDEVQAELPEECEVININTDLYQTAGMIISLSGPDYSYSELASFAEKLKDRLIDIDGITRLEVIGEQENEVCVEIDTRKLNTLPLSLEDVANVIQAQIMEIPLGSLEDDKSKLNVTLGGNLSTIADIENIVLLTSTESGSVVRVKDIADVYYKLQDSNYKIKTNGENAVLLTGYFQGERNVIIIGREVEKRINTFREELPDDLNFNKVLYQPDDVKNAVDDFIINLIEGVIFVIIVVFVGMGFRNAILVSTSIPLSILITFIAMRIMGIDIHQISIAALIIALGMLVDNAIVVSDAIQVRIDNGEERLKACVEGAKEVAIPVLMSTLTTVGAFLPLLLLSGMAGEFIRSVPQIVIISLSASYIAAVFISPVMAYVFFKPSGDREKRHRVRTFFENLLRNALRRKKVTMFFTMVLLALAVWLVGILGLQFFPKADTNKILIDIQHEHGNDVNKTEQLADHVANIITQQPEVTGYTVAIGDGLPKLYYSMPPAMQAQDYAQMVFTVDLGKGERFKTNEEFASYLQNILDSETAMGTATIKLLEQGEPIGAPVRIRVLGQNQDELVRITEEVKNILKSVNGTFNIRDDHSDNVYDYYIDIDSDETLRMGLTNYDLQKELNIALMGRNTGNLNLGSQLNKYSVGKQIPVKVISDIDNIDDLKNFVVKSSITGSKTLLKQVSEIGLKAKISKIKKYDRVPAITVYSDVMKGYSSVDIQKQVEGELENTDLGEARVIFDGERESIFKYFGNIGVLGIMAVFIIYLLLLIEFGNFSQPFIIMVTIPLSSIGSIIGLYLFGQPLSFTSFLGMVSLFGVVINNAIVLVDHINYLRTTGKDVEDACIDAVVRRFRPIMLTTITTLVGLVPLIMSGSNLFTPMSISLASGLAVSTLLTLVIIPVVYAMVENRLHRK
ncbi:MAG: efflux RND transporter permease subunit [Clostridiaceae bacterium]|nr:efflux RND transporter permease subunit [Clostridiaceae bacterium]